LQPSGATRPSLPEVVQVNRDEIILGAVVGFGFAAFESSGYALVAACTREHFLITGRLLGAYIGVSPWDSMPNIAVLVTFVLTGNPLRDQLMQRGFISRPTESKCSCSRQSTGSGLR
jgi:hypothetical protein